ncbi:hypothetical protein GETHLI_23050 [Geothrix limicola]|uniref:SAM domain-containing protein n=1 Tax=Geothrix limicola TaxID=2927978 RepID=A0ABQ5QGX5_9BACT|nr:hypothetical protein [Geothrix limicola]GLH73803.1 hypothetical protein GETHLI_23050 [Geothrix limicola]
MGITEQILADHATRKDVDGITWFTAEDLKRLGIQDRLFTVMQTVQHTLRLKKAHQVVESHGCTDRWSLQDVH